MDSNLHIIVAPADLAYADAITRFQVDMAIESEGLALDFERTLRGVQSVLKDETKGIFKAMYNKVMELAQSEETTQVRLYVDKDNQKAQTVYQKLGMSECHYLMYEVEL